MNNSLATSSGGNGEQETIIKPDHQLAFHLGYERLINEKNSSLSKEEEVLDTQI